MNNIDVQKPEIYLAGPLGFSEVGRAFHNGIIVPMVREIGFKELDPWALVPQAVIQPVLDLPYGPERKMGWQGLNRLFGQTNAGAIMRCKAILAVLDGTDVDSGTASEIGFGAALGKPIVGYRGDFRLSQDNDGCVVNLQVEYFMFLNSGSAYANNVDDLRSALVNLHRQLMLTQ